MSEALRRVPSGHERRRVSVRDTRYVKQNVDGGWDVLREGDRRTPFHADTQQEAISRARALVRKAGGGQIRVVNRAGKIVGSDTVAKPKAPRARRRARMAS
jgi:hypothetical protein